MPEETTLSTASRRTPWNKGKLIGAKPPLRTNQVWSIRTRLMVEGRTRDLAMFNLAIDWHAFTKTDQGDPDLSVHRQSPGRPAFAGPHEDRKHRPLSRHRSRRRARDSRAS